MKLTSVLLFMLTFTAVACDEKSSSAPTADPAAPAPTADPAATAALAASAGSTATKYVDVVADDKGFHPSQIKVSKGQALTLRFKRTSEATCATAVEFPDMGIKKPLPLNETVAVNVPTGEAKTLVFQCGMGMYKSSVVIN